MIRNMDSAGINGPTADSTSASGRMENKAAMENMSLPRALSKSDAGIKANAPSGSLNRKLLPLKLTLFLNDSFMTLNLFKSSLDWQPFRINFFFIIYMDEFVIL